MIYLDNNSTTQLDAAVYRAMDPYLKENYANPSSIHTFGKSAAVDLENARALIAKKIQCDPQEIFFMSSGTEGNNFCIKGFAFANREKGNHIITSQIEHPSVLNTCAYLETQGFSVTYLDVDHEGFILPKTLKQAITDQTILISIAHGNSEIGTLQRIDQLKEVAKEIVFHVDAVQTFLKHPLPLVDMITISGHKFHAPKGVGLVYKRKGIEVVPQIHGGQQEQHMRSGTENLPSIIGLVAAINAMHTAEMPVLQLYLIEELQKIRGIRINGPLTERICSNINFSYDALEGEVIVSKLSKKNICTSTGSACSSKSKRISHVLQAIKCPPRFIHGNVRIGISKFTTRDEIDAFLEAFCEIIKTDSPFMLKT